MSLPTLDEDALEAIARHVALEDPKAVVHLLLTCRATSGSLSLRAMVAPWRLLRSLGFTCY